MGDASLPPVPSDVGAIVFLCGRRHGFSTGRKRRIFSTLQEREALWSQLEENHDATLERHCELWEHKTGTRVSISTMSRAIREKLGWSYKKPLGASERDEEARSAFRERLRSVDPKRLTFVDESSTNVALTPRYARAPRGERAHGKAPRNWGKNVTLISSITSEGMGPSMSVEGPSDTESFGRYMREILAPRLEAGQVVLMDNLPVHTSGWVRELIEQRGCQLWLLPSYSPDLNPIEEASSKVKNLISKVKARTLEALFEVTAQALSAVSADDARGYFEHCGYSTPQDHSL